MSHHKDIRTSENVESHYIDNQTMCISIPRWNLWFELKEHQITSVRDNELYLKAL